MGVHIPAEYGPSLHVAVAPTARPRYRRRLYRDHVKRVLDVVLVLLMAPPVLLTVALLAALVALDGANPFYVQERLGRNRRVFRMWKLRSMIPQADQALEAHLAADPAAREEWDRTQKLRHDPRVTAIGDIIRRTSLDELPQLFNVLKGDMSLVGPRPMMPCQEDLYPGEEYFEMRPGITGFWQTSVRNECSFSQRAGFDAAYFRRLSLATDVAVLLRTVRVVLRGTGC